MAAAFLRAWHVAFGHKGILGELQRLVDFDRRRLLYWWSILKRFMCISYWKILSGKSKQQRKMCYTSKNIPNRTNDSYSEIMAAPGKLHF